MMRRRGPGLMRVAATTAVVAGTAGAVSHHQQTKYANQNAQAQATADEQAMQQQMAAQQAQIDAMQAQQAPAAAPAPAPAAVDPTTAALQNLANLHAQGILSDEEFAAAKAKALGI